MRRRALPALLVVLVAAGAAPAAAAAADPGRWTEVRRQPLPLAYYQGVAVDHAGRFFFDGVYEGLYRTDGALRETASNPSAIPADVKARESYNHLGDIAWDAREGGRVLLPAECYYPGTPNGGNSCRTGSIGVADPETLRWRYYVKLDPRDIAKAMWNEVSPDGRLLWTQQGRDLLAYDMDQITQANAAPSGPLLRPVRRLAGAVPPSGITGAAFVDDRLYVAGTQDDTLMQVWSIDLRDGSARLEIEREVVGESEGLVAVDAFGGELHWMITPFNTVGRPPTYYTDRVAFISFKANRGVRPPRLLELEVSRRTATAGKRVRFRFLVKRKVGSLELRAAGATIRFAGQTVTTDANGRASLIARFATDGRKQAIARLAGWRGDKEWVTVAARRR